MALFFALGRFLAAFCVLAAFVLVLGRFFCVLERSRVDFGGSWGRPGKVWEVPRAYFSMFLRAHALALRKSVRCAKNTVFLRFSATEGDIFWQGAPGRPGVKQHHSF